MFPSSGLPQNLSVSHLPSSLMVKCGQMWSDVVRCGQMWSDFSFWSLDFEVKSQLKGALWGRFELRKPLLNESHGGLHGTGESACWSFPIRIDTLRTISSKMKWNRSSAIALTGADCACQLKCRGWASVCVIQCFWFTWIMIFKHGAGWRYLEA